MSSKTNHQNSLSEFGLSSPIDQIRFKLSRNTIPKKKSIFGQFLTSSEIAKFMARLFLDTGNPHCQLLDPGAGIGSLSSAFLERCIEEDWRFDTLQVTACEIDNELFEELKKTFEFYTHKDHLSINFVTGDFIEYGVNWIQNFPDFKFTHAIMNPPYKKINSNSHHRKLLRKVGIETVNLYTAFLALTIKLMKSGGQIVAIIPRSFCNGPYYRPFREFMLKHSAIRHLHLFESRNKAFKNDNVLQENIIIMLEKDGKQTEVSVSTSTDDTFANLSMHQYNQEEIIDPSDYEMFIHIPTSLKPNGLKELTDIRYSIQDLGINVSTGPVVDFRVREHLHKNPEPGTVPLIYPSHFIKNDVLWPKSNFKKWNAISDNLITKKWLYPSGFYCVVRRFSSKEEKRRVIPNVIGPKDIFYAEKIGFENHLNVFHSQKQGLPEYLAIGLSIYLNTSVIDEYFRSFSGHTQVNATDLRMLKYPSRDSLISLGKWAKIKGNLTQIMIDKKLEKLGK